MKKILAEKNVIVTGTSRGLGKELVHVIAEQGGNVIAHARTESEEHKRFCIEAKEKYGVNIIPLYFDLTDIDKMKEAVKIIRSMKISIDGLVNNAGIAGNSLFQMTSLDELKRIMDVDFFAPFAFTQYISKLMVRQGKGSIVNISSTSALDANSGKSAYGSAKAALCCMTRTIAEELGEKGVRSNAVCPGVMKTDMLESMPEYIINVEEDATFLGRLAMPRDVAGVVTYLLSDMASYITGQIIRVDGGKTLYRKHDFSK